jgi:hypothetical protein
VFDFLKRKPENIKTYSLIICLAILIAAGGCASSPAAGGPAETAPAPRGPLYAGDGGRNTKIAVLQPQGENLALDEQWLSSYIQGTLNGYFSRYTAVTVIDRQNLDKIIDNQNFSASGYFSDNDFISLGNISNAEYILIGSLRKIPQDGSFMLDLSVSHAGTGQRMASFAPSLCTFGDIQRASIIQKAFEDIAGQLGITLTEYGKQSLYGISNTEIAAETSLSKGITAQKNNRIGEALSYYYNAASFSPAMPEVKGRISGLSSSVSSGSLGENVRNLIAWRNAWGNVLKECDEFLENHIPFEIIYDTDLKQVGNINYKAGTIDLSFSLMTKPADGFKMIDDVLKGLKKTGRQEEWGFQSWPFEQRDPTHAARLIDAGGEYWRDSKTNRSYINLPGDREVILKIALVNDKQEIIATINIKSFCRYGIITWQHEYWSGNPQNQNIYDLHYADVKPEERIYVPVFKGIDANKITDTLTIKILSIDDIDVETGISNGYIKISEGIVRKSPEGFIKRLSRFWNSL